MPAVAQNIRKYGDDSSSSSGSGGGGGQAGQTVYPGQPVPQSSDSGGNNQSSGEEKSSESEKEGTTGSYEIRMHGASDQQGRQQTQQQTSGSQGGNRADEPTYQGIVPGERDEVEHLRDEQESGASASKPNKLTWLGFQPKDDKTRVFIQTARASEYNVSREDDGRRVIVTLENTGISTRNFRRSIDTSFFDRNISRIDARPSRRSKVEVTIELESPASPSVEANENYLYVDFPYSESGI